MTPAARLRAMAEKARGTPAQAVIIGAELAALYADLIEAAAAKPWIDHHENMCRECGMEQCIDGRPTVRHESLCGYANIDAALAAIDAADKEGV